MSPELDRALTRLVNLYVVFAIFTAIVATVAGFGTVDRWNRVLTPERRAWFDDCRALIDERDCGLMVLPPVPVSDGGGP